MQRGFAVPLITDFTLLITPHLRNDLQTLKAWGGGEDGEYVFFYFSFCALLNHFMRRPFWHVGTLARVQQPSSKHKRLNFAQSNCPTGLVVMGCRGRWPWSFTGLFDEELSVPWGPPGAGRSHRGKCSASI